MPPGRENYPDTGRWPAKDENWVIFFRYTPRFGRARRPRLTVNFDPNQSNASTLLHGKRLTGRRGWG
jgi:hypothetical protein